MAGLLNRKKKKEIPAEAVVDSPTTEAGTTTEVVDPRLSGWMIIDLKPVSPRNNWSFWIGHVDTPGKVIGLDMSLNWIIASARHNHSATLRYYEDERIVVTGDTLQEATTAAMNLIRSNSVYPVISNRLELERKESQDRAHFEKIKAANPKSIDIKIG